MEVERAVKKATEGRGVDAVIVATSAPRLVEQAIEMSRPGANILLFAQTSKTERVELTAADSCVGERTLLGSYSADIDLQPESSRLVFDGDLRLAELIYDRLSLDQIEEGIQSGQH